GGQPATEPCREAISRGSLAVLGDTLEAAYGCVLTSTVTSVASCWTKDFAAWRAQAVSACSGVDPFGSLGYSHFCSGTPAASANSYAPHAFPCSFNVNTLDATGFDNDVLDCATCEANEGALGVARDLFGANLCCIGGSCTSVLTRYACRRDGGPLPDHDAHGDGLGERARHRHGVGRVALSGAPLPGWRLARDTGRH